MDNIDYSLTKQHFNVRIYKSYLQYISRKYPAINVAKICADAGLPYEYIVKSDGWVSIEFNHRFMAEIRKQILDPQFEFKVGQTSFSKEIMGPVYFLMKTLLPLEEIYGNIWKLTRHFNKVVSFESANQKRGQVTIKIRIQESGLTKTEFELLQESLPDIVSNALGFYSGFAKAKNVNAAKVSAVRVSSTEYFLDIKYPLENSMLLRSAVLPSICSAVFAVTAVQLSFSDAIVALGSLSSFLLAFAVGLKFRNTEMAVALSSSEETLNNIDTQYKSLVDTKISLQRRLSEAEAINQITNALIQSSSEDEILQNATDRLTSILDFDRVIIMLQDADQKFLEVRGYSVSDSSIEHVVQTFKLPIDIQSNDPTKVSNIYRFGSPVLIADVNAHRQSLNSESAALLEASKSKSFIAVPVRTGDSNHGVLLADTFFSDRELTTDDMNILVLAGRQIAIALEKQKAQTGAVEAYIELGEMAKSYSRFVPFQTIELLGFQSVTDISLKVGREISMAIVFCDIRGFTTMSESMSPSDAVSFLNSYFSSLAPILQKNNGVIDKFMGDGIMAFFMNPKDAIKACGEFQHGLAEFNMIHRSGGVRDKIKTGMGVHFGKVLLGAVGYEDRLSISVVSDAVNVASRLDGLTKRFGVDIICSEEAFLFGDSEDFRLIAHLKVDGRRGSTKIYEYFGHLEEFERVKRRATKKYLAQVVEGDLQKLSLIPGDTVQSDPVLKFYAEEKKSA